MKTTRQDYQGHRIELRPRGSTRELLIDNQTIPYGQLPEGLFFLHEYAYDWRPDLLDLARRFIDYRARTSTGGA